MNAVIYTRFSPRRNADESESCETQEALCLHHAKKQELEVRRVFHDRDVSGADEFRQVLWSAIESLEKGDVLIVYKRDRLARDLFLSEQINRAVASRGAAIEAVTGDISGDTAEVQFIRQVLASVAEYERKMIGMRTSHAMKAHQKNGRRMSAIPPYGWKVNPDDPARLVPVPDEQEVVERIQQQVEDGKSVREIVRELNRGYKDCHRSGYWRSRDVERIVARE